MTESQSHPTRVLDGKVWCPACAAHVTLLKVSRAAKLVGVNNRVVYNYIKKKKLLPFRIAGTTVRVCGDCLSRVNDAEQQTLAPTSDPHTREAIL